MKHLWMFTLSITMVIASCKDSSTEVTKTITYEGVINSLLYDKDTVMAITDAATWENLCEQFWYDSSVQVPQIDFQKEQVVAIFYRAQSGCGPYSKFINKIESDSRSVKIYHQRLTAEMMGYCNGWFYPRQIVKFNRENLPVEFVIQQ